MWIIFAILSAVFAAATSVLAKIGIDHVDSNIATTIQSISPRSWLFLILPGLATGAISQAKEEK